MTSTLSPVRPLRALLIAMLVASPFACSRAPAELARGDAVPFPDGYRDWHHVKSMVIQPGHALHDAFGGMHHVYANAVAKAGLQNGTFADGAVFAFDLLDVDTGGNAIQEGKRKVLGVMHKSGAAFPDTGGWGFAGFGDGGKNVVTDMQAQCFQCHLAQKDHGFVFTRSRP